MFGPRHRLRHLAVQVLLAWLFALAAGIVNACVLEPELRHGVVSSAHGVATTHGHDASASGAYAKFCDDPSASAQILQPQIDQFSTAWLAPLPAGALRIDTTPRVAGGFVTGHDPSRPAIPIPIAFLRLTL